MIINSTLCLFSAFFGLFFLLDSVNTPVLKRSRFEQVKINIVENVISISYLMQSYNNVTEFSAEVQKIFSVDLVLLCCFHNINNDTAIRNRLQGVGTVPVWLQTK